MALVKTTHPDGSVHEVEMDDTLLHHAVDESGIYLGLVSPGTVGAVLVNHGPPKQNDHWKWDLANSKFWRDAPLDERRELAKAKLESAVAQARRKYVTPIFGQDEAYTKKATQARAFAENAFEGTPPPFILKEAEATNVTPSALAASIIAAADAWDNVANPAIEGIRQGSKKAIMSATSQEALDTIIADSLANLAAV